MSATNSTDSNLPEGFKWILGRGFKDISNPVQPMPTDDDELVRANLQHYVVRSITGYHAAPVKEALELGCKVLEVGCGTGIWSIEMANTHPASEFIAADIVDTFCDSIPSAPANLNFQIADTKNLPFPDNHFDFVYQAMAMASFREREWPSVICELVRVTKPGGWVELFDCDGAPKNAGPNTLEFFVKFDVMMSMRDVNLNYLFLKKDALEQAGLENLGRVVQSIPMGWGPVEIAQQSLMGLRGMMEALKPQMTLALGLGEDEFDDMMAAAEEEFVTHKQFWDMMSVWGRKPVTQN